RRGRPPGDGRRECRVRGGAGGGRDAGRGADRVRRRCARRPRGADGGAAGARRRARREPARAARPDRPRGAQRPRALRPGARRGRGRPAAPRGADRRRLPARRGGRGDRAPARPHPHRTEGLAEDRARRHPRGGVGARGDARTEGLAEDRTRWRSCMSDVIRWAQTASVPRNAVWELELLAATEPADPWAEIELDVEFTDPDGRTRAVPAFWNGGRSWKVRYSSATDGVHRYRSVGRAAGETGLEGVAGELTVTGYDGANPLLLHGGPRVADDGRHLAHGDGTPFFWLGDTWWTGMTGRFRWPNTFQTLAADRAAKGFSVIQIVAGLVPEFDEFSPGMASEGGQPWLDEGSGTINPAFWHVPDLKADTLV